MEQETAAKKRLFNMLIIWAFLPGIPCIYYGDELGMQGAVDPFNRGCLEDNKGDSAIQSYYKALLAFRESIRDIGHMAFKSEQSKGGVYAFSRSFQNSVLQVRVNAGTAMESLRIEDWPTARNKSVFINGHVVFTENGLVELGEQAGFICYYQN
jgi:glycosidase